MTTTDKAYSAPALKLDPSFYHLTDEEKVFFQKLTGIADDDELKEHIIAVQTKAYERFRYPCIWGFSFVHLNVAHLPSYGEVQRLREKKENALFLDLGCGFGNALRKVVVDGWPANNTIASDLNKGFWDYGHELFKSNPKTFPAAFVAGNIFDPEILAPALGAVGESGDTDTLALPPLQELTSLTPLRGKISAIHAASFFHLFDEKKQQELAHRVSSLLMPEPGSVIFGSHFALPEQGIRTEKGRDWNMFCHSPQTWTDMWLGVFDKGDGKGAERIKVETEMFNVPIKGYWATYTQLSNQTETWILRWSITLL